MEIKAHAQNGYITLVPSGEIDAHSSIFLDEKLDELISDGQVHIHINLGEISYVSSAGMGVFISKLDEIANLSGKLVISSPQENVRDGFDLLGLNQLITIVENEAEVVNHFQEV